LHCSLPAKPGRATLVGAGSGDAELLTLKAMSALQPADAILFDDPVSEDVLKFARREAKRLMVGKRGGQASYTHGDINNVMARLTLQGRQLVCLKSGDPMIIDRGEEALPGFLRNAGAWAVEKAGWPVGVKPKDSFHLKPLVSAFGRELAKEAALTPFE
jgi:uroporphyrin-III C-methyltransferase/precorrin-2 dehydrogenase/sirohydrochlorin ferrochelatase